MKKHDFLFPPPTFERSTTQSKAATLNAHKPEINKIKYNEFLSNKKNK